jgi:hypothetical protein
MKLKHQVEKKLSVRSAGPSYTLEHAPTGTGSEHPGQAIGQLEFYVMLAHGARHNLREMATYKADKHTGDRNDENEHIDFWNRVRTGQPLPAPKSPFAYKKFESLLTGLGVNIRKDGNELVLTPLTDKGVLNISNGEIQGSRPCAPRQGRQGAREGSLRPEDHRRPPERRRQGPALVAHHLGRAATEPALRRRSSILAQPWC